MAIQTTEMREALAVAYGDNAPFVALFTSVPGATPGTEVSGGGYARQPLTWTPGGTDGQTEASVSFNVPGGTTVRGFGIYDAGTGGTYLDGNSLTEQAFGSAGTLTLNVTYTQS